MKATKQFKIGEYVVGGIIRIYITGKVIEIKFQDYFTKEDIVTGSVLSTEDNAQLKIRNFIEDNGTPYYADKVLEWITSKVDLPPQPYYHL